MESVCMCEDDKDLDRFKFTLRPLPMSSWALCDGFAISLSRAPVDLRRRHLHTASSIASGCMLM